MGKLKKGSEKSASIMLVPDKHSSIKSYVLRAGRITAAQQRALCELWPHYGVVLANEPAPPNWAHCFNRAAPLALEIGAGFGEASIALALAAPQINHIAVEVHPPAIGALLNQLATNNLHNVRIVRGDIAALLPTLFADNEIACVRIFFPDPWPKKRHHKRRLINAAFLQQLATKIKRGGFVHIATDWANYADSIRQSLQDTPALHETAITQDSPIRPPGRFARRAIKEGRPIADIVAVRGG